MKKKKLKWRETAGLTKCGLNILFLKCFVKQAHMNTYGSRVLDGLLVVDNFEALVDNFEVLLVCTSEFHFSLVFN